MNPSWMDRTEPLPQWCRVQNSCFSNTVGASCSYAKSFVTQWKHTQKIIKQNNWIWLQHSYVNSGICFRCWSARLVKKSRQRRQQGADDQWLVHRADLSDPVPLQKKIRLRNINWFHQCSQLYLKKRKKHTS